MRLVNKLICTRQIVYMLDYKCAKCTLNVYE